MKDHLPPQSLIRGPAVYRIRVGGCLTPEWSECLQGMTVSIIQEEGQETCSELSGLLPDQAALMGVLAHLCDCGIPLLSVGFVSTHPTPDPPPPAEKESRGGNP